MTQRLDYVRKIIEEEGLGGFLITSRPNTFYFTGFTGSTSKCLVTREKAYIVVDFRYTAQAREQVFPGIEVIEYEKSANATLDDLCRKDNVAELGIEGDDVTYSAYRSLQESLKSVKSFRDLQNKLNDARIIKDGAEIEKIQKAVDIADKVFEQILQFLKPGVKEMDIAAEMEYQMKMFGAKGPSFETIIASGPRSALPHGVAGTRELQNGDAVVMDFGAVFEGYCSDITRTVFIGKPNDELLKIYDTVLKAQLEAINKAAVGMKGKDLDNVSRTIIYQAGYEKCFGHGLGHGVGVEIHEKPTVSPRGEEELKSGMVFTIEPGIYIEGFGGVRIEDTVLLTDEGLKILTKSTKDLIVL
ncbi:Xaa-Pro peptidase family protein [Thermoclostridium stercorarium]|uniref:M24 family metallopeptidase n=1 Tax=Thermoclostridium stercorarium TaxID=1510 RepID=UPI002248A4EC|nr:Xaa-Pro peptidase family protein [Thermoclostridium stercorarium]UZQ86136.1 Xaa-Pro peptidase family protein [Thermoclostridium stercorarium]